MNLQPIPWPSTAAAQHVAIAAISLALGAAGAWTVAAELGNRELAAAIAAGEAAAASRLQALDSDIAALTEDLNLEVTARLDAEEALRDAEDRAAAIRAEGEQKLRKTKAPVPAPVRAARVVELLDVQADDVVPFTLSGRPGYWLAEHVLVDLEAARTVTEAWELERTALDEALQAARRSAAAAETGRKTLEALAERWRAAYEAEAAARRDLAREVSQATGGAPEWLTHPVVWGVAGVAVGAVVTAGLLR